MARKYPKETVDAIAAGARVEEIDGLPVELRPIPGDSREGVLDPTLLVFTREYMVREKNPENDFMYERTRYSRETYPFAEGKVERRIRLLDFGDRLIPVHFFKPENFEPGRPVLVYMHGGGFVANRYERYDNAMRYIAFKAGIMVVYPEYRFAPECPFPGPLMDCNATVDWVIEHADEL
ncbi:MAG: alpha/beta hydrolase fold domain-containing protein, partial [Atopobiaceae bacterium]|nr:alpha/beta hydrolase fold domain-containing protein [Atopobiaceae bacterium]